MVTARVEGSVGAAKWGLIEPGAATSQAADGVLIGRTLLYLEREGVPLRLMNMSDHPHRIKKGTELAVCEPMCGISICDNLGDGVGNVIRVQGEIKLPNYVRELYKKSIVGLDKIQKEMLYNLFIICIFWSLFTGIPRFGPTDLVKHRTNTSTAAPGRQPPRQFPFAKREEADKAIAEMKDDGIIEPSASPWSSLVVLVKKKDGSTRFCVDYRKLNSVPTRTPILSLELTTPWRP